MKNLIILAVLMMAAGELSSQNNRANLLFGYTPAPGQFINNPLTGTPDAALKILDSDDYIVSLGAYGGSIILGFEKPVFNNPLNPYGIDFSVFGNAFPGSSEPGVVWVMKDENQNGLPDDTWYEIAGSSYYHPGTLRNGSITWYRQPDGSANWKDNTGREGHMLKNEFHNQPYYPSGEYFPEYPADSVTFTGSLLGHSSQLANGQIVLPALAFGYADNQPVNRGINRSLPDNPYTAGILEGAGGDPVDISWAVDAEGNYIDLDVIHFVKIVTGAISEMGVLGEISAEIGSVVATQASGTGGKETLNVIHPHSPNMLITEELAIYADFFVKGRRTPVTFKYEITGNQLASVTPDGKLSATGGGTAGIWVSPQDYPDDRAYTEVYIQKPESVILHGAGSELLAGQSMTIKPVLLDQENIPVGNVAWMVSSDNEDVLTARVENGLVIVTGYSPGAVRLEVFPENFPELTGSQLVTVKAVTGEISFYGTAKTNDENLSPARWITVAPFSVNGWVDNRQGEYGAPAFVSLAQAVAGMLLDAGKNFRFRDDEASDSGLYLYSVESDGRFTYGWGGKTSPAAYARAWIVRHNGRQIMQPLDSISVNSGDTIQLYNVHNILDEWSLSILKCSPDSVGDGETIHLVYQLAGCALQPDGKITENALLPLGNQAVYISDDTLPSAHTDDEGKASLVAAVSPPFTVRSGTDAVFIAKKLTTGITLPARNPLVIYPNPAGNHLFVEGATNAVWIKIFDMSGQILLSKPLQPSDNRISLETLGRGVYMIVIEEDNVVSRQKFIRL